MGKKLRPLEFYGYDYDSTMVKKDENYKDETFQISKVMEQQNKKYIKLEEKAEDEKDNG